MICKDSKQLAFKIKRHGLTMTHLSKGSHIGAILSVADIIAVLYAHVLHVDSQNPKSEDRDRLILSKGHAGAAVYAALAESGFFDVELLKTHYQNGSLLSGHVSHKGIPGIEFSTGSLGHGLPVGVGMALAAQRDMKPWRTYVVCGDGECDEGSVWESALIAHHLNLDNLTAVIDYNKMQSLDFCERTIKLEPFTDKWRAFGWHVIEVDGHDHASLLNAFHDAQSTKGKPSVIIAHTVKGKGISFMENNILWHYRTPQGEEYEAAVRELEAQKP